MDLDCKRPSRRLGRQHAVYRKWGDCTAKEFARDSGTGHRMHHVLSSDTDINVLITDWKKDTDGQVKIRTLEHLARKLADYSNLSIMKWHKWILSNLLTPMVWCTIQLKILSERSARIEPLPRSITPFRNDELYERFSKEEKPSRFANYLFTVSSPIWQAPLPKTSGDGSAVYKHVPPVALTVLTGAAKSALTLTLTCFVNLRASNKVLTSNPIETPSFLA